MRNRYLLISAGVAAVLIAVLSFVYTAAPKADNPQTREQREQPSTGETPGEVEKGKGQAQGDQREGRREGQGQEAAQEGTEAPAEVADAPAPAQGTRATGEASAARPEGPKPTRSPLNGPNESYPLAADGDGPDPASVESAAVQVMRRVSRDDKTYSFDEKALRDISVKLNEYGRSAQMRDSLRAMQSGMDSVAALSRREGLEPGLVAYASLALSDGGGAGGDPVKVARSILPSLSNLNKTLGSSGADSSLILLAAYSEGVGTKRSHPLLARIRQLVRSPLGERNVWFLHEQGVINDRAYGLVINFLASGIIAGNPRQFGVDVDALTF